MKKKKEDSHKNSQKNRGDVEEVKVSLVGASNVLLQIKIENSSNGLRGEKRNSGGGDCGTAKRPPLKPGTRGPVHGMLKQVTF